MKSQAKITNIYIVRHGETEGNIKKIFGLVPRMGLTKRGIRQVRQISEKLSYIPFEIIVSSDLLRAKQTAEIFAKKGRLPVVTSKDLRERSFGRLNGKTGQEIRKELKGLYDEYVKMPRKDKYYFRLVEDMETVEEAVARFMGALQKITTKYKGKNVLVVSHVTPMRGLLIHLGYVDHNQIDSSCIENTAYIKLESDGTNFIVRETFGIRKKV